MHQSIRQGNERKDSRLRRAGVAARLWPLWIGLALLLAGPRITSAEFGIQGDLPLHFHITRSFARSFAEGDWIPRWAGLLDGGNGDALFTFYPPLSYLVSAVLMRLFGLDALGSLKLVLVITLIVAQAGAYSFARVFFDSRRALAASALYVLLPAFLLIGLNRGFYANAMGLSLAPLALLGAHRVLTAKRSAPALAFFSLAMSAVILTHAITTYLCGLAMALMVLARGPQTLVRDSLRLLPAGILVFGLTAFFLVPQQLEMKWVRVGLQLVQQDFRNYLLFATPQDASNYRKAWSGLNQVASYVTIAQSLLALLLALGCGRILRGGASADQKAILRFAIACAAFGLLISLPIAAPIWTILPGLKYIQFPWRFQPFVGLGCCLLAVSLRDAWPGIKPFFRTLLVGCLIWVVITNLVFSFLLIRLSDPPASQNPVRTYLVDPGVPPVTIDEARKMQDEDDLKFLPYAGNQIYFRPATAGLMLYPPASEPGGLAWVRGSGTIILQNLRNAERDFVLECKEASEVRLETFAYPHWVARLDGREIPITTEKEGGRMLVDLPAGTHQLNFRFEVRSGPERAARWLSLVCWLLFGGWMGFRLFKQ